MRLTTWIKGLKLQVNKTEVCPSIFSSVNMPVLIVH